MVNKSILFVGYSLQKTYFFEKHCEYLHQNYMCEVEIICLDSDYGASRSGIKDILVLFFKIFFKVRKINPDLIVSITPKAGLLCGLLSVFLQRVTFVHWFTGQVWCLDFGAKRLLKKLPDLLTSRLITNIFCDSHPQKRYLLENGFRRVAGKIKVFGKGSICGVDCNSIEILENKMSERLQLGVVGRINSDKGFTWLLNNFTNFNHNDDFDLHIFGSVDEPVLDSRFNSFIESNNNVFYYGEVLNKFDIYNHFDALISFSYREGFSNVILEAQAYGKPVLARKIYAIEDTFKDGETGLYWNDIETLCNGLLKIKDFCNDKTSKKCKSYACDNFNEEKVLMMICNGYLKLLDTDNA